MSRINRVFFFGIEFHWGVMFEQLYSFAIIEIFHLFIL